MEQHNEIIRDNIEWKTVNGVHSIIHVSNYGDLIFEAYYDACGKFHKREIVLVEQNTLSNSGYYFCAHHTETGERFLHRFVAKVFIGYDDSKEINHIDGNKLNEFVGTESNNYKDGNLEWTTRKENMEHASQNNLINKDSVKRKEAIKKNRQIAIENAKRPVVQLDLNGKFISRFDSVADAERATGYTRQVIARIASKVDAHKSLHGYQWIYEEEYDFNKDYSYNIKQFTHAKRKVGQYDLSGNLIAVYSSRVEAAKAIGSPSGDAYIGECCLGKREHYKGYHWKNID